jgi:hypothetical protein
MAGKLFDLSIEIDTLAIEERVAKMADKMYTVPVPAELTAWQSEDMNRQYPQTQTLNATAAFTMIYPRSRKQAVWLKKKRAAPRKPVLRGRATLFDRLRDRMNAMMARELKW